MAYCWAQMCKLWCHKSTPKMRYVKETTFSTKRLTIYTINGSKKVYKLFPVSVVLHWFL